MYSNNMVGIMPKIVDLKTDRVSKSGYVTTTNIMDETGKRFAKGGLFDTEIFGEVGTDERINSLFGLIDLGVYLFNPYLYADFISLSSMFPKIIHSKMKATFDKSTGLFTEDSENGETGFEFMVKCVPYIKLERNESDLRDSKIDSIYRAIQNNTFLQNKLIVIPAGLREYEIIGDSNSRAEEGEINDVYRKILNISSLLKMNAKNLDPSALDPMRVTAQGFLIEIYELIWMLLDGKHKYIRGSMASKEVTHSTANVFSSVRTNIKDLRDIDTYPGITDTTLGLLQTLKGLFPFTVYHSNEFFINDNFSTTSESAILVDINKLKWINEDIDHKEFKKWTTPDGLNSIINNLIDDNVKNKPVYIDKLAIMAVADTGDDIYILRSPDDLPDHISKDKVRAMTYGELFYNVIQGIVKYIPRNNYRI